MCMLVYTFLDERANISASLPTRAIHLSALKNEKESIQVASLSTFSSPTSRFQNISNASYGWSATVGSRPFRPAASAALLREASPEPQRRERSSQPVGTLFGRPVPVFGDRLLGRAAKATATGNHFANVFRSTRHCSVCACVPSASGSASATGAPNVLAARLGAAGRHRQRRRRFPDSLANARRAALGILGEALLDDDLQTTEADAD